MMKKPLSLLLTLMLMAPQAVAAGRIQDSDVKSLTDVGGNASRLINTSKLYDVTNGQQLSLSIANGQLGGGGGGTNYVTNGSFETGVTGTAAYADVPGAAPVTGAGTNATPSLTCTRSTSPVLTGSGSLLITKPASNVQGQGCATNFTVGSESYARVLQVTFDYQINTGSYTTGSDSADSDLVAYVYGPTDGTPVLTQLAPYKVLGCTAGLPCHYSGRFQTASTGKNYRLILHEGQTGTAAYSMLVDSVSVSPQTLVNGAPVTDWVSYTPTITGTTTNPTLGTGGYFKAYYRRIGDSMAIRYEYSQTAAGTAGSGIYLLSLPPGYSIDTSKISGTGNITQNLGSFYALTAGTTDDQVGNIQAYDAQRLQAFLSGPAAAGNAWSSTNTINFGLTSLYFGVSAFIPIVGWSSTVQMSNDTDTRVVALSATGSSSPSITGISGVGFTANYDTLGGLSGSVYTVKVPGYYSIQAAVTWSTVGTANLQETTIIKNGNQIAYAANTGNSGYVTTTASVITQCNAGDTIQVNSDQNSGSAKTLVGSVSSLNINRLSGPSAIAATETVAAYYTISASGSAFAVGTTAGYLDFANKVVDTHGAVLGAGSGYQSTYTNGWRWVAPTPGLYEISAKVTSDTNTTTSQVLVLTLAKNNAQLPGGVVRGPVAAVAGARIVSQVSGVQTRLVAGDIISIAANSNTGTINVPGVTAEDYVSIKRIGN